MPDFPTGVPDIADASPSETLVTMHAGAGHAAGTNRILTNLEELAKKLGIGPSTPGALAGVLRRTALGSSAWGLIVPGDITPDSLTAAQLATSAVGTDELGPKVVTAAKIADDTITALQIAPGAVGASELGLGAIPRGPTLKVAAVNATATSKLQADYVCDGTDDQVEINAALTALPGSGGKVQLSEGTFTFSNGIASVRQGSWLAGMGMAATVLQAATGQPVNVAAVTMNQQFSMLSDLYINNNKGGTTGTKTGQRNISMAGGDSAIVNVYAVNSGGNGCDLSGDGMYVERLICLGSDYVGLNITGPVGTGQYGGLYVGCRSFSHGGSAFSVDGDNITLLGCQAKVTNTGFVISANADNALLANCEAIANNYGFQVYAPGAQLVGCFAGQNGVIGFQALVGSGGTVFQSCKNQNSSTGFSIESSGFTHVLGCHSYGHTSYGISVPAGAGQVAILGCSLYSGGAGSYGIYINGGANHLVQGNRVQDHGGYGIHVGPATGTAVLNNLVVDSGKAQHNTYAQIIFSGTTNGYVAGNACRMPAAAPQPSCALQIVNCTNCFVGSNDLNNGGIIQLSDNSYVSTRRAAKRQLALDSATLTASGSLPMTQNVELTLLDNTAFTVQSGVSLLQVGVRLSALFDGSAAGVATAAIRIDSPAGASQGGIRYPISTLRMNAGGAYGFLTSASLVLENLAIGTHTIKLTVLARDGAGSIYMRASNHEFLSIDITEIER